MRRISLRFQFTIVIVLVLTLLFAGLSYSVIRLTTNNLRTDLVERSKSFAALATEPIGGSFVTYQDSGLVRIKQEIETFTDQNPTITNVTVVDIQGQTKFTWKEADPLTISTTDASSFEPVYIYEGGNLTRVIAPFMEDYGAHRYSVVYDVSHASIDASVRQLALAILFIGVCVLLVSLAITYVLINKLFIRPIQKVSEGALIISRGQLTHSIGHGRNDEVGDLVRAINTMADALKTDIIKLQDADRMKSEFMTIASHNLRTPLSIIDGYLDTLLHTRDLTPEARQMVDATVAASRRLSAFAEDIITVSRLEAGENLMSTSERTDMRTVLFKIADEAEKFISDPEKVRFQIHLGTEPCIALVSLPHIRAALWNLIDNAIKFTESGDITLQLSMEKNQAVIEVIDTGVGIAASEVSKLFTKFHRGTDTLKYDYEGTGMGLYITKLIIQEHGGTIGVSSQLGKGSTFKISLPLATEAPSTTNAESHPIRPYVALLSPGDK